MARGGRARITYVGIAGAVVLAGVGEAPWGWVRPAGWPGRSGAVCSLVAGVIVDRVYSARDNRGDAIEARRRVLDALTPPVPEDPEKAVAANRADPLALLRADRSPMPFRGRSGELRRLAQWRDDDAAASPVFLLSGPAGIGKSRLALQFASRAPAGWAVGWLHAGTGVTAVEAVAACGEPAVILVDDADGRPDLVPLLDSLAEHDAKPPIRLVLVTRSAEGLRAFLVARLADRHAGLASGALARELEPEGGSDDGARWFDEAVRAFAVALGETVPVLPEVVPAGPSGATTPFVMIQAQALLAVLGTGPNRDSGTAGVDPRRLSFGEVAGALMRHEEWRWDALAKERDWGSGGAPSEDLRGRAVASLALLGADSDSEAAEVLRRVPELRDALAERRYDIAAWIGGLYPGELGAAPRIRPDVIGEWFVVSQLTAHPALAQSLRAGLTDEQAARALELLARAADWLEPAGSLFGEFAAGDLRRQVIAAAPSPMPTPTPTRHTSRTH